MTTKTKPRKRATPAKKATASVTGKYVYDPKTDRIVKVSDRIPSVASKRSSGSSPCGEGACESGPCGDAGGGCGGGACGL